MTMVTVDDAPMAHTGPTLPSDFPAHLLLRICDAILAPLLNPYSPIKPYTKPWSRSAPSPWNAQAQSTTAKAARLYSNPSTWTDWKGPSVHGSGHSNCKNDLLAFAYCNRRLWDICGDMAYRHIRVMTLAVADILVSRRNILRHTRVLEIYITRDVEASQAQTDLNLSRFFIQAGIILLWAPCLHTIVIDLRAIPADQHIWSSFLSRLRQRLFISKVPGLSREPPRFPSTSENNIVDGAGGELPTSRDPTARWGDSQGLYSSPDKVSIPHFALGMGYAAAGEVERGFGGVLDILFSPNFPVHPAVSRSRSPFIIGGQMVKSPGLGRLDVLTTLDLLVPRPSWGHEEAEGFALGLALRRLRNLKRLGFHADGVIQNSTATYAGFGLKRKPPFGTNDRDEESEEEEELDMTVDERGATFYPARIQNGITKLITGSTGVSVGGYSSALHDGGYGPETWWAGVLNALTYSAKDLVDSEQVYPITDQSIEEFRIAVSGPTGNVPITDFDAFFWLVLPYFHKMPALHTLIFDMVFPIPTDAAYMPSLLEGKSPIKVLYDRQRHYVEKLADPFIPSDPLVPERRGFPRQQQQQKRQQQQQQQRHRHRHGHQHKHQQRSDTKGIKFILPSHGGMVENHKQPQRANTLDPHMQPSLPPLGFTYEMTTSSSAAISLKDTTSAKSIRYVFFGEYSGLPSLPAFDSPHPRTPTSDAIAEELESDRPRIRVPSVPGLGRLAGKKDTAYSAMAIESQRVAPAMWWTVKRIGDSVAEKGKGGNVVVTQGWEEVCE